MSHGYNLVYCHWWSDHVSSIRLLLQAYCTEWALCSYKYTARVCAIYKLQYLVRLSITHGWDFCWQKGRREQTIADALQQWFVKSSFFPKFASFAQLLVKSSSCFPKLFLSPQIGSNIFLTAAHCLENWAGEVQTPSQLKIILGVQNRRQLTSTARFYNLFGTLLQIRGRIQLSHEWIQGAPCNWGCPSQRLQLHQTCQRHCSSENK